MVPWSLINLTRALRGLFRGGWKNGLGCPRRINCVKDLAVSISYWDFRNWKWSKYNLRRITLEICLICGINSHSLSSRGWTELHKNAKQRRKICKTVFNTQGYILHAKTSKYKLYMHRACKYTYNVTTTCQLRHRIFFLFSKQASCNLKVSCPFTSVT